MHAWVVMVMIGCLGLGCAGDSAGGPSDGGREVARDAAQDAHDGGDVGSTTEVGEDGRAADADGPVMPDVPEVADAPLAGDGSDAGATETNDSADVPAPGPRVVAFRKIVLTTDFISEGAGFADFDRDGKGDVMVGPFWYAGPDFSRRYELYPPKTFEVIYVSETFHVFTPDLNNDGWADALVVGYPGLASHWYENPKTPGMPWQRHLLHGEVGGEMPFYVDFTGDGKRELVFAAGGTLGYAEPDGSDPRKPWTYRALTPAFPRFGQYMHGFGVGDVDGDGRQDLLEATGIWYQPAAAGGAYTFSPHTFGHGGAHMFAYDIDADGDRDVVATIGAHESGLSWFEQLREPGKPVAFKEHVISEVLLAKVPPDGVYLNQPHAVELADVNGDGLTDIISGDRFWGHIPGNRNFAEPAVIAWFELQRSPAGATFKTHVIDRASGVGCHISPGDIDGDGDVDIVVANKKGAFVFLQEPGTL